MANMTPYPLRLEKSSMQAIKRGVLATGFSTPQLMRAAIDAGLPLVIERNLKPAARPAVASA